MNARTSCTFVSAFVVATAANAHAWEFRCRFIERIGTMNVELPGNLIDASNGEVRNIRVQFGVFDDADGAAPAGGFVGWNVGTIAVSGSAGNSDERRNPGRISPFNFAAQATSNGFPVLPAGDPFTMLTEIDSTLGTQSPSWVCNPDWTVPPMPAAVVRGMNTYVSVYAFSIDPSSGAQSYGVSLSGNLIAATSWGIIGNPSPPDCSGDPSCPSDCPGGSVTYVPITAPPQEFSCALNVLVPSPAGVATCVMGGAFALSRRGCRSRLR